METWESLRPGEFVNAIEQHTLATMLSTHGEDVTLQAIRETAVDAERKTVGYASRRAATIAAGGVGIGQSFTSRPRTEQRSSPAGASAGVNAGWARLVAEREAKARAAAGAPGG